MIELFKTGEISELVCFEGDVECPDDMSQSDFSDFEYLDTLLDLTQANCSSRFSFGMKDWIEEVIPSAIGNPKTITGLLEFHLRAEFGDLNVYSENRVVGTANFVDFEEECLIFERIPITE
ncbi:hypothetical protein RB25_24260 [Herbaspirillum rubrisubalbicans]|nr:hypothetical protein RB25_24260 [Herbaspirillum rubrisubalbicans]